MREDGAGTDRAARLRDAFLRSGGAGGGHGCGSPSSIRVVVLARQRTAADGALFLDVPLLAEGDERDDDQQDLHWDEDDHEEAEQVLGKIGESSPSFERANQPVRPRRRRWS